MFKPLYYIINTTNNIQYYCNTRAGLTLTTDVKPLQGHAAPVLYAVWAETGYLKENELLNLRKVDSILEGHPVPVRSQTGL